MKWPQTVVTRLSLVFMSYQKLNENGSYLIALG